MNKLFYYLGILGILIPFLFITIAIAMSPWFSIFDNALSDLGNIKRNGQIAYVFNIGLILGGLLISLFSIRLLLEHIKTSNKYWLISLVISSIFLASIGIFPEDAGSTHFLVSVSFFIWLIITLALFFSITIRTGASYVTYIALTMLALNILTWIIPWPWKGVAIQEAIASLSAAIWLLFFIFKHLKNQRPKNA